MLELYKLYALVLKYGWLIDLNLSTQSKITVYWPTDSAGHSIVWPALLKAYWNVSDVLISGSRVQFDINLA